MEPGQQATDDLAAGVGVDSAQVDTGVEALEQEHPLARERRHEAHGTVTGAPGSRVQVLLDGELLSSVPLDWSGSARILALGELDAASVVSVRYVVGDRTGPASTAIIER